ncbi:formyltransferase family protein [Roseimaritima sediminicola]|uniref:formyltransferase family protein n=1 Tax=Roseimaritima sediminicola TaxID=2662066 RepID=UPI00129836FB|nr:formyltransferase family protein [Roseimaritima sediminicola]
MKKDIRVLFLGKQDDEHGEKALNLLTRNLKYVTAVTGEWGQPFPSELESWQGDFIVSYLSRWILPEHFLRRARLASINFHPATPSFPGVGCNNFALYQQVKEFGVTCHHMSPKVDTGGIIAVKRFPVYPQDDVASLLARTYDYQLLLFYEIFDFIFRERPLPSCPESWTRKPFTRRELRELCTVDPSMDEVEIRRRIRATSFRQFGPMLLIGGKKFVYQSGS